MSGRNEIDFNQRAYNYIAAVVVTDADNSQPFCLPVLQHDYISLSPCSKPVSLTVCLCLALPLCVPLGEPATCLPVCMAISLDCVSCLKACSFVCASFNRYVISSVMACFFACPSDTRTKMRFARRDKKRGGLGMAAQKQMTLIHFTTCC